MNLVRQLVVGLGQIVVSTFLLFGLPGMVYGDELGFSIYSVNGRAVNSSTLRMMEAHSMVTASDPGDADYRLMAEGILEVFYSFGDDRSPALYGTTFSHSNQSYRITGPGSGYSGSALLASNSTGSVTSIESLWWIENQSSVTGGITWPIAGGNLRLGGGIRQTQQSFTGIGSNGPLLASFPGKFQFEYLINPVLFFQEPGQTTVSFVEENSMRTGPEIRTEWNLPFSRDVALTGNFSAFFLTGNVKGSVSRFPAWNDPAQPYKTIPWKENRYRGTLNETGMDLKLFIKTRITDVFSLYGGAMVRASMVIPEKIEKNGFSYDGETFTYQPEAGAYTRSYPEGEAGVVAGISYRFKTGQSGVSTKGDGNGTNRTDP